MSYLIRPMPIVGISKVILKTHRLGRYLNLKRKKNVYDIILCKILHRFHRFTCSFVGCYVPFGSKICRGLILPHGFYGVFLSKRSILNFGVTVLHQVTIGSNPLSKNTDAPIIGSYSFVGAGAKVIGKVKLPPGSVISVNEVVTKRWVLDRL
ncbi:hypothetical protein [Shewanella colwelliana]|uniref:hypothetical protein n=1 Tax=Shewanella colwelliana TaxID=23 RepID=UPI001C7D98A1|nr:hypothetical protein [Shewanella colwelliana]